MIPLFDQNGLPNDELNQLANELEDASRNYLHSLVERGYSATDIRAASGYLTGCVDVSGASAILDLRHKLVKDRIRNTDPNLQPEEYTVLIENAVANKIRAIKMYRERTGQGLRESKDAVEAWIKNNL